MLRSYSVRCVGWEGVEQTCVILTAQNVMLGDVSQCICVHWTGCDPNLFTDDSVRRQIISDRWWPCLSFLDGLSTPKAGLGVLITSQLAYRCNETCIQIECPVQILCWFLYDRYFAGFKICVVGKRYLWPSLMSQRPAESRIIRSQHLFIHSFMNSLCSLP